MTSITLTHKKIKISCAITSDLDSFTSKIIEQLIDFLFTISLSFFI